MKTALCFLVALIVSAQAYAQQWVEHRSIAGGYRIDMPGTPQVVPVSVPTVGGALKTDIATLKSSNNAVFVVFHVDIPSHLFKMTIDEWVADLRRGVVLNSNRKIHSERQMTMGKNNPAVHFIIGDNESVQVTRIVRVGDRQIQAVFSSRRGGESGPDVEQFFSSFALIGE